MAAYAALVSLRHIIEHIQHHPRPPISLDKLQVESLTEKVTFLQDFLESYSINGGSEDEDGLESRIADAAHAAEDIIESRVVDQILAGSKSRRTKISSIDLYQALQRVIREMESIQKKMIEIKDKKGLLLHDRNSISTGSLRSPSTGENMTMVGFDDVLIEIMDKLTGQQSDRQIISIVGMGGIGKTTLARNIYVNPLIVQHFDFRCWATISQEYNIKQILSEITLCVINHQSSKEIFDGKTEHELGMILHKSLSGRRYLIIMDDIWGIDVWDDVKFFFPDNNNGSRIMITTRLSNIAFQLSESHCVEMSFLDEDKSWNLFCKNVFGEESCPLELEEIGKKIAKNCKGLPLSIVVIGGFLSKSQRTRQHWEYIAENLTSIVNSDDDERCLKILHMSYKHLPVHLKPCFLYMGVFPEDSKIRVSSLIKLWVAEGFLKPISDKSLEMVARYYLEELIDRNLILVHQLGSAGNIKICTIHDLLRDLCLREAQKQRFLNVVKLDNVSTDTSNHRRISIPQSVPRYSYETYYIGPETPDPEVRALLSTASLTRSLICDSPLLLSSLNSRLLRVFKAVDPLPLFYLDLMKTIFQLVNSRYIDIRVNWFEIESNYLSSFHMLWNLQTLVVQGPTATAPSEFWNMSQLRHVRFHRIELPDPQMDGRDHDIVLSNLQTLLTVSDFKCGEEMVKRIPNIKKLQLFYDEFEERSDYYCLNNLGRLHKLESFSCIIHFTEEQWFSKLPQSLTFPRSLKKLTLLGSRLNWDDMATKIRSLPHLQVLKLKRWSFIGPEWETVEGRFCSLKFLLIQDCYDLEYWTTDSTHFPRLERLVLRRLDKLKEIPSEIVEIPTLQSIELEYCSDPAVVSARKIVDEQEELGNVGLQVRVVVQPWEKLGRS